MRLKRRRLTGRKKPLKSIYSAFDEAGAIAILGFFTQNLPLRTTFNQFRGGPNGQRAGYSLGNESRLVVWVIFWFIVARFVLYSVRRDENANGMLDMPNPLSFRHDIVCAEHCLIDGLPHDQPVELCSGDLRVSNRKQVAIRPPL